MIQNNEHEEQCALVEWWRLACMSFGIPEQLLFAIPNGGLRNQIVARKMKAEGVRAGIPDLFLAVPVGPYSGLFVEMKKAHGGKVSCAQIAIMSLLNAQGYKTIVCHGWSEARELIKAYLGARNGADLAH